MAMAGAAAIVVVGALVKAWAAYQQGQATASMLNYQAKVAENQAKVARQQAGYEAATAQQATNVELDIASQKNRRVLAAQRARYGGAGVSQSEGSALFVEMDAAEQAALENARIRYAGTLVEQAALYRGELAATSAEATGRLRQFESKQARIAGNV